MKFVVTGALGHIGSALIRTLPRSFPGCTVVMIDNMMTQRYPALFNLPAEGKYEFHELDVINMDLTTPIQDASVVIHLAAITDAAGTVNRADELERNNYQSTLKVAEECARQNVPLIAISSTSVYGSQKNKVDETCSEAELAPQSPYAATKLKEELLIRNMASSHGLRAVHCRFGTIFGTSLGMRFHTAVNKFCWQAAIGSPLTIWETAYRQKRPYLSLDDACAAIEHIIRRNLFDAEVYNILTANYSVEEVVENIKLYVPDLKISFVSSPIMNQLSYDVLNEKFEKTGFTSRGSLTKGVERTMSLLGGGRFAS